MRQFARLTFATALLLAVPALHRLGITERDLWTSLRRHGIHNVSQVGAVVVEHDGRLSILRAGTPVNRSILVGVRGAADLPDDFYAD